jgi:hypothetical protein
LKIKINQALVIALPKFLNPFEVNTNSSGHVVEVVLMKGGRHVCYHSEIFHGEVLNYPTYDKELYALVQVFKKWKHYMMGRRPSSTQITSRCSIWRPRETYNKPYIASG